MPRIARTVIPLVLLGTGCAKSEAPEPPPVGGVVGGTGVIEEAPAEAEQSAPEVSSAEPRAAVVTLIDAGEPPLSELRYRVPEGQHEDLRMVMTMEMAMHVGDQPMPSLPEVALTFDSTFEVLEVLDNGDIRYRAAFGDVQPAMADDALPDHVLEQMRAELEPLTEVTFEVVVSNRGHQRSMVFLHEHELTPQLDETLESMRAQTDQLSIPLPEEPVGPGATWRVEQQLEQQGMQVAQQVDATLVEVDGDEVVIAMIIEQTAEPQTLEMAGMPPGTSAELLEMSGHGQGQMHVDFTRLTPVSKAQSQNESVMQIDADGEQARMTMSVRVGFEVGPKP